MLGFGAIAEVPISTASISSAVYSLAVAQGDFSLTGVDVALKAERKVAASPAAFSLTGNAVSLLVNRRLVVETGAYVYLGLPVTLTFIPVVGVYTLTAAAGVFTFSGVPVSLLANRVLLAEAADFNLTGQDANLTWLRKYYLSVGIGAFILQGYPVRDPQWMPVDSVADTWELQSVTTSVWTVAPGETVVWH